MSALMPIAFSMAHDDEADIDVLSFGASRVVPAVMPVLERGLPLVLFLQIVLDEPHSEVDSLQFRGELEVGGATIPLGDLRVAAIVWSDGGRTGHVVIAGQVPQTAMTGAGRVHIELGEPSPDSARRSSANITLR
jgi:hypothetical protein